MLEFIWAPPCKINHCCQCKHNSASSIPTMHVHAHIQTALPSQRVMVEQSPAWLSQVGIPRCTTHLRHYKGLIHLHAFLCIGSLMRMSKGNKVMMCGLLHVLCTTRQLAVRMQARPHIIGSNLTGEQVQQCYSTQGCIMQFSASLHSDAFPLQVELGMFHAESMMCTSSGADMHLPAASRVAWSL